MDSDLIKAYRRAGVSEARGTQRRLRREQAVEQAVGDDGRIFAHAMPRGARQVMAWGPGDSRWWPVDRAGRVVLLRAQADTAPTTGAAVITLIQRTELGGDQTIGTVRIPQGRNFSDPETLVGLPSDVSAATWLRATVTTANGAANVSSSCSIEVTR